MFFSVLNLALLEVKGLTKVGSKDNESWREFKALDGKTCDTHDRLLCALVEFESAQFLRESILTLFDRALMKVDES